jgi:hypothetical protein
MVSCGVLALLIISEPLSSVALIVAIVVIVCVLSNPFIGIALLGFTAMLGELQRFRGGVSITQSLLIITMVAALLRFAATRKGLLISPLLLPVAAFLIAYAAGSGFAADGKGTIAALVPLAYVVAFFLTGGLVRSRRQLLIFLGCCAAGATIAAAAGIMQQLTGTDLLYSLRGIKQIAASNAAPGMVRSDALMLDPNAAAYPEIISIPLLLCFALSASKPERRFLAIAFLVLCVVGIVVTFSRSAYIGITVSAIAFACLAGLRRSAAVLALIVLTSIPVLLLIPSGMIEARFSSISLERGGASDRSINYKLGAKLLVEHPLVPLGDRVFEEQMLSLVGDGQGPHSNLIEVAMTTGIIGLCFCGWVIAAYIKEARRMLQMSDASVRLYYAGIISAVVGFMVQGLFITNIDWVLVWCIAAIPVSRVSDSQIRNRKFLVFPRSRERRTPPLAAALR